MISNSLRAYNIQGNNYPSVFLYQKTPIGVFDVTEVEAEVSSELSPVEKLCLEIGDQLEKITRVEVHAISGITIEECNEYLQELQRDGLIILTEYDRDQLTENIDEIEKEIGSEWITSHVQSFISRAMLKQYTLTKKGKKALESGNKKIRDTLNMNIVIVAKPFYVYNDQLDLKPQGYDYIEIDDSLTQQVLGAADKFSEYTGIKPYSIGSNSVIEGKEVVNSKFWITLEGNIDSPIDEVKHKAYLTSRSFDRWSTPKFNEYLLSLLPEDPDSIEETVVGAISETYQMVKHVIEEGLSLADDKVTWILEVDLEMQMLIFDVMKEPISETSSEITLKFPNSNWKVVILLQLEPYDDLSARSLKAGRFHQIMPRKGFTLEEGYEIWNEMHKEWDKSGKRDEYLTALETLVEYDCLTERGANVDKLVVDVDNILSINQSSNQPWQFNRLREIEKQLEEGGINEVIYLASDQTERKVDEVENFNKWVNEGKIEMYDSDMGTEVPYVVDQARQAKIHYLGNLPMGTTSEGEERFYSRTLKVQTNSNHLRIPDIEPTYDRRDENLFKKMYNVYYE